MLIVGGGLVGATLAYALAQLGVATVLVEQNDPGRLEKPGFDGRSTAMANASQRILAGLGLWDDVANEAEPILAIHVSERGRFGAARFLAAEEGVAALGYTLENRVLTGALWPKLRACGTLTCLAPGRLDAFTVEASGVTAHIGAAGTRRTIRARLLVAADGARSRVRRSLGIGVREDDYRQTGVVLNCTTELPHDGRAFERFTPGGPIAMLPLTRGRMAVVWTRPRETQDARGGPAAAAIRPGCGADAGPQDAAHGPKSSAHDPQDAAHGSRDAGGGPQGDAAFRDALQQVFGYRLGRIREVGARSAWPLRRIRSAALTAPRTVLVGSAAFSLHPVAGQGFNLALRDIATLAELIRTVRRAGAGGAGADPGSAALLDRYSAWRAADQRRVAAFTHGLVRLFAARGAPLGASRGLGLMAFDLLPHTRRWLARQAMGLGGRTPRLARGLPLTP